MKTKVLLFLALVLTSLYSPTKALATQASASCSPSTGTFNVGDTFTVDYVFDTRSFQVFGADLNITYDAGIIEAVDSQSTAITSVTKWTNVIANTVDKQLGKIHLDYGNGQPAYSGSSTPIGRITFKAKQAGQAQFQYTFFQQYDDTTPGVTKIWGKKDGVNLSNILTDVTNCIYVVTGPVTSTPAPTGVNPTTPAATSGPQVTELPRAGVMDVTFSLVAFSLILLTLGTVLPALSAGKD